MSRTKPFWDTISDLYILDILDRFDNQGASAGKLAQKVSKDTNREVTRSAILSIIRRTRTECGASHHDGTMPPRWWERAA